MLSALRRSLMRLMQPRRGCVPAMLVKVSTGRLYIARKNLDQILVQMRAHDDPQAVNLPMWSEALEHEPGLGSNHGKLPL